MEVEVRRGTVTESRHRVHVAVVDATRQLVAHAGDPDFVTFWRSAAKPFQAMPLVSDGAADHFKLTRESDFVSKLPDKRAACASISAMDCETARTR